MLETTEKPRLRLLLDQFALIEDDHDHWRVAHPLPEVLLLVVCGTIAAGDDFEDIADWGEDNLAFLRRFLPYHHGVPGARWLGMLMNRIDPGCSPTVSNRGRRRCAPTRRSWWPSTARPRVAAMIATGAGPRCIWFRPRHA